MKCDKESLLLYAVTDRSWLNGETLVSRVEKALQGGATFVQLREKELNAGNFLEEAKEIKELCRNYNIPFVVNDDVSIAIAADADGVHVGQGDMETGKIREMIGKDKIIGVSATTLEQAVLAERSGADYLGVGAVFPTGSKADAADVSYETLKKICGVVNIPVVAIGGISNENVMSLSGSGVCGIAAISAIFGQRDIIKATSELKASAEKMVAQRTMTGAIFDLDGTILDSMAFWGSAGELFLKKSGVSPEPGLDEILFTMTMTEGASYLKERYGLDLTIDEIMSGINHLAEDYYHDQVQLKEGAYQLLNKIKQAGIKITAATTSDRHVVTTALERLCVMDCFDRIFTCTESGAGKDKPDIFLEAAEFMGTIPQDTWVFEDSLNAIQTAKKAGFRTVGVHDDFSMDKWGEIRKASDISTDNLDIFNMFLMKDENNEWRKDENSINYCRK